jgi:large subunit ribosomal protein L7/L12
MSATCAAEVMEIGDQISALSPSKAGELLAYLKETYNIEPAIGLPSFQPESEKKIEKTPEQSEFSVILTGYDTNNKIGLVKTYREMSGKGLKESMDVIVGTSSGPGLLVKEGMSRTDAEKLKATLEANGGKVEIK